MPDVNAALAFARAQLGKPYRYGSEGPNTWDCSGLTQAAWAAGGVKLNRTSAEQLLNGRQVSRSELKPGDLVWPHPGHVQLYVGNGQIIEAPRTGEVVKQRDMWGFWTARRVAETSSSDSSSGGIIDTIGGAVSHTIGAGVDGAEAALGMIPGVDTAKDIVNGVQDMGHFLFLLTQPSTWVRVVKFGLGGALIIVGIGMQKPAQEVVGGITNAALTVAAPQVGAVGKAASAAKGGGPTK